MIYIIYAAETAQEPGGALEALRALGCFRASRVAELYCEGLRELRGLDPGIVEIVTQLVQGSRPGGASSGYV